MAVLVAAALLAVLGMGVPALIDDGLAGRSGRERAAAEEALRFVSVGCTDHPISRLFARKVRVESVRYEPGRCRGSAAAGQLHGYRVALRVHTFFGVPRQTIVACGGEFDCYSDESAGSSRLGCAREKAPPSAVSGALAAD